MELDKLEKIKTSGEDNFVYVFTDELYVHQNHLSKFMYLSKDEPSNGKNQKWKTNSLCNAVMDCDGEEELESWFDVGEIHLMKITDCATLAAKL